MECEAADGAYPLRHEGRIVPDDAELFTFQAEDLHHLLGGAAGDDGGVAVDGQGREGAPVGVDGEIRRAVPYVQELDVPCLRRAHDLQGKPQESIISYVGKD